MAATPTSFPTVIEEPLFGGLSNLQITGIVVGSVLVCFLMFCACFYFVLSKAVRNARHGDEARFAEMGCRADAGVSVTSLPPSETAPPPYTSDKTSAN